MHGLDWAWGHLSAGQLHAAGATFACRYLSHDQGKNLSAGEAKMLSQGGVDLVVVFEDTAGRALQGRAAGRADAQLAARLAKACGQPAGRPIFFAVDFDASPGQQAAINDYFRGVADVIGHARAGAYGGYWPLKRLLDARLIAWAWQTYAWSGGNWDARAHLRQYSNGHTLGGVGVDWNEAGVSDFGQWRVGAEPKHPDPLWFLLGPEHQHVRRYDDLKRHRSKHAAKVRAVVVAWLVIQRKRIWTAAHLPGAGGWGAVHRTLRYRAIRARTDDYRRTQGL